MSEELKAAWQSPREIMEGRATPQQLAMADALAERLRYLCFHDIAQRRALLLDLAINVCTPPAVDSGGGSEVAIPVGMVRWSGGTWPPSDWQQGDAVMARNGQILDGLLSDEVNWSWNIEGAEWDCIAYTPKPTLAPAVDDGRALREALALQVAGIANTITCFPGDAAWGGADQARHVAAILNEASAALHATAAAGVDAR